MKNALCVYYYWGLLIFYAAVTLTSSSPPPLQDYPTWVYEGVVASGSLSGHVNHDFILKAYPVPNVLTTVGLAVLDRFVAWQLASKLWICFYLVLSGFSCVHLIRSISTGDEFPYWVSPTIGTVNLCFWYGFINFQFAVALLVLFCSLIIRGRSNASLLSLLLVLLFLAHAVPFLTAGLILVTYIVQTRRYRLFLAFVPSLFLCTWYLYGRFVTGGDSESSILTDPKLSYRSTSFFIYKINTFFKSLGYVDPLFPREGTLIRPFRLFGLQCLVGLCLLLGLVLGYLLVRSAAFRFRSPRRERFVWFSVVSIVIVALVCPSHAFGISDPGSRFMVCALALGVLIARPKGRLVYFAQVASLLFGVVGGWFWYSANFRFLTVGRPAIPSPSSSMMKLAHVSPMGRSQYYLSLEDGRFDLPVFGTGLLANNVDARK